ncbi:MAG: phosphatase PAP2 family protein [Rhodothermales bacterium]|nr:phosphatase PAP2 family protein [Rhodothermales bacterium]
MALAVCWNLRPCAAQDHARFVRWAFQDAVGLGARALPLSPVFLTAGGLVIPAGKEFDEEIRDGIRSSYKGTWGDYLDVMNELGSRYTWIPATSVFAASLLTDDRKFQDAAFTSVETILASVTITATVKFVVGRSRPEQNESSIHLRPFSGRVSFPSGHTTVAFAVISPWVFYYPGPITYSLFALSASTGVARIAKNKHWPTDVLAGAAVGILTGRWLSRRHQARARRQAVVSPFVGLNTVGITIKLD